MTRLFTKRFALLLFLGLFCVGLLFTIAKIPLQKEDDGLTAKDNLSHFEDITSGSDLVESDQTSLEATAEEFQLYHSGIDYYGILIGSTRIGLGSTEDDLAILGTPTYQEVRVLENADTFTGTKIKTLKYEGIDFLLASFSGPFRVDLINVTSEKYPTVHGIRVGDSSAELLNTYKELRIIEGSVASGNYMGQIAPELEYLEFCVENGRVVSFEIFAEWP